MSSKLLFFYGQNATSGLNSVGFQIPEERSLCWSCEEKSWIFLGPGGADEARLQVARHEIGCDAGVNSRRRLKDHLCKPS